ncbi:cutinase family protein [Nocardia yunnanensis]|uniref:Cutinase family protein n=1 Tax=Nocardia yunnanensis TaxID=2382165 RepID=A0A386Z6V3_9NOCA|nr:cutinase family protein [Nocardia yunnanensis]AYF72983.1 cutinase family protein [Nocardia yunnanensis]
MNIRDFMKRHRIASAVAAPAALGLAAVVAVTFAYTSSTDSKQAAPALKASVTECHDMVTISVAGRNDSPQSGTTKMLVDANGNELPASLSDDYKSEWLDPVVNAPGGSVDSNSYWAVYVSYPANLNSYEDAVNTGVANTEQVMRDISAACPNTKFAIVGYSEGADVTRRVAQEIGHQQAGADGKYGIVDPGNVAGVVILADSGRSAGDGPFIGAKDPNHPDNFGQNYQTGKDVAGGQGALQDHAGDFGALNGRIASFCSDGDLTCAAPKNISLLQLAINVGRQINADQMQNEGLNQTTGIDVAMVLGKIAGNAFADIAHNPGWWTSKETFLDVLLKVSAPDYKPNQDNPTPVAQDSIQAENMSPLAYLPQKVFNEVVGLITSNQNTIPVILSDPYNLTLGPDHTGHHFDYWHDQNPNNGKPVSSAEYAAAWLTELAKEAQAGQLNPKTLTSAPTSTTAPNVLAAARASASGTSTPTSGSTTPATTVPGTTTPPVTTPATPTTTPEAVPPATTTAPVTTTAPPVTTTPPATTTPPVTATTAPPTTTTPAR